MKEQISFKLWIILFYDYATWHKYKHIDFISLTIHKGQYDLPSFVHMEIHLRKKT
jgi:hypothetical protein